MFAQQLNRVNNKEIKVPYYCTVAREILRWSVDSQWSPHKRSIMRRAFPSHDVCRIETKGHSPWWRHQMVTFSALLALCARNSPVTGEFPLQRPVTRSFDVFFDVRLNKRLSKQSWGWWFETPSRPLWRHSNDIWICKFVLPWNSLWVIFTCLWYFIGSLRNRRIKTFIIESFIPIRVKCQRPCFVLNTTFQTFFLITTDIFVTPNAWFLLFELF